MESRLERIDRDLLADGGTGGGLDYADQVWLVDMVKAYQEYCNAMIVGEMHAAQKALGDVENRK